MRDVTLIIPDAVHLEAYRSALENGWSPDTVRGKAAADEQLEMIVRDPTAFIASLDDPEGVGAPIELPDGTHVPRLPAIQRWIWDGEFCGSIGFRWQPGTSALPPYVLGHIGFAVVPWKRRQGYATRALSMTVSEAKRVGLVYIELTTAPENIASQCVISANGGTWSSSFKSRQPMVPKRRYVSVLIYGRRPRELRRRTR